MIKHEGDFLHSFFNFLLDENINYIVLRNYKSLPITVNGTDIDILVDKSFNSQFRERLINSAADINYKYWKEYNKNFDIHHMIFFPTQLSNPQDVIRLDFIKNKINWFGMELIDRKILWEHKTLKNGLYCLDEPLSNAVTILNGLLYCKRVKNKYYEQYDQFSIKDKELVQKYIANTLRVSKITIKREIENRLFEKIRFRFIKAQGFPLHNIFSSVLSWLSTLISRLVYPPGIFIAFVGPDGSGKSTIAALLETRCQRIFPGITYFHLFPKIRLFRAIDKISNERWEKRQKSNIPEWKQREKKFNFISSLSRLFYLYARFLLGYISVYFQLMKGNLVISDRWCYDLIIDPGSKGIKLSEGIRKLFLILVPKPDKIIALVGDPKTIVNHKPELDVYTVAKQINVMNRYFSNHSNIKFINTEKAPEKSFKEVLNYIVN